MNDKNSTPDQTPENLPSNQTPPAPPAPPAPQATPAPASEAETVPVAPIAADATAAPAAAPAKPGRKRALLIGGGIAAAVVLVGGGVALGAAVGDEFGDDDDRPSISDGPRGDSDDRGGQPGDDRDDDGDQQGAPQGGGPVTGIGTDSADDLVAIADAARGAAEGDVTSIDAKRDGTWEVQLTAANGSETEVRVDADLAATVVSTEQDDDDSAPTHTLDEAAIRALVDAALAEADGMITDLDADNDEVSPYDASVLTSDRRSIDIDFSADYAVVGTDIDD
ncbi:hypothetical protein [Microbacterium sp. WCS2018Hpa-23]|uniref:hypothetical protein n=1 Tax=Microbacterium sp. WCS2018Hpa-23 TaxID=3073634 RepID=UPI002883111F|nr:hypothetical protein [Microbacterium sp. WCS2018Hpa-23]